MLRLLKKCHRHLVLVVFFSLTLGGPAFHHLPIFGLHGDACSETVAHSACEHGHHHDEDCEKAHELADNTVLTSTQPGRHLHGTCLACEYYAQGSIAAPYVEALSPCVAGVDVVAAERCLLSSKRLTDHLARGPPVLFS